MQMKKFINKPENIVPNYLEGLALSHPDKIRLAGSNLVARAVPEGQRQGRRGDAGRQRP